jgi:D-3-phosphoglycerate dehydrogenase / 2-oxoglutarate reductase
MKIVITDHRFPDVEQERRAVEAEGWELVVSATAEELALIELCRDADGIITARAPFTRRVLETMERCRIIVRYGIGIDTIDIAAANECGIAVANVPDYCVDEVSDHALTLLLMLSRQIMQAMALARHDRWSITEMPKLNRLRGRTCGLLGCGRIGGLLAVKASVLGMNVIAHDPFISEQRAREVGVRLVSFDDLLTRSDFVSLHAPLTKDTYHRFDREALTRMRTTASIINTSRGGLIDEPALIAALDSGRIAGAGLDVLESENSVTNVRRALVNHPKVLVTAHTGWLSEEARLALQRSAIGQVIGCLKGEKPYGIMNDTRISGANGDALGKSI